MPPLNAMFFWRAMLYSGSSWIASDIWVDCVMDRRGGAGEGYCKGCEMLGKAFILSDKAKKGK